MTKRTILPKTAVLAVLCVLLATPLTVFSQQKPAVPTVHNRSLDEKFLKLADNDEERAYVNDLLSKIYTTNGSYLGSAMVQQNIDVNMFLEFLDGNVEILKRFDENAYNKIDRDAMKKVVEKSEPIKQWLNENYFNAYYIPLGQFDHLPEFQEVSRALDKYVKDDPYELFGENHFSQYVYAINASSGTLKQDNTNAIQRQSDLISCKISAADGLLFKNLLEKAGIYKGFDDILVFENFNKFMVTVRPIAE